MPGLCDGTISARQLNNKLKSRSISVIKGECGSGNPTLPVRKENRQGVFKECSVASVVSTFESDLMKSV